MAIISTSSNNDKEEFDVTLEGSESNIILATGGTYVDKNIIIDVPEYATLQNENSALLTYANENTGAKDASIGDAVKTLVAGYGKGGIGNLSPYYEANGSFTLDEDFTSTTYTTLYDLPDTNYDAPRAINSRSGSSIVICKMDCDTLDFSNMSLSLWSPNSTLTGRPLVYLVMYYRMRDGILYNNNDIVTPLSYAPYLQYNRVGRVSGKCTTSATSSPAGNYTVYFKAYDYPF